MLYGCIGMLEDTMYMGYVLEVRSFGLLLLYFIRVQTTRFTSHNIWDCIHLEEIFVI